MKRKPARPKSPAHKRFRIFLFFYVVLVFLSNVVIGSVPGLLYHLLLGAGLWVLMLCWFNRRGKLLRYIKDFAVEASWRLPFALTLATLLWFIRPQPDSSEHFFAQYLLNAIHVIELNVVPFTIAFGLFIWMVHFFMYPYRRHPRLRMVFKSKALANTIILSLLLIMLCRALAIFIGKFAATIFVYAHSNPYETAAIFIGILMGLFVFLAGARYLTQTISQMPK